MWSRPTRARHGPLRDPLRDDAAKPLRLAQCADAASLSIGTAAPNNALDTGLQLTTEFSNGKDQTLVRRSSLEGSNGFLGFGMSSPKAVIAGGGPVVWATVKNQFFAAILTPDEPAVGIETRRVKLLESLPDLDKRAYGITAAVDFDVPAIPAHGETTIAGNFYVGPKEYPRLSNMDVFHKDEDRVMDFGNFVFRFCAALLLTVMTWFHSWTANWGIAIILTTLALKFLFLPITLAQSRTSRRTQKVMPELKAIKEKYKDNPQKLQAATMELYKKHKINPVAGCLPMLLTIPFFWAFFTMLRSAAELRFASFLWARDLSAPDTIGALSLPIIGLVSINVLPILLGVVNFVQMHVTPQPAVDNAQMKMMKFMPRHVRAVLLQLVLRPLPLLDHQRFVHDLPAAGGQPRARHGGHRPGQSGQADEERHPSKGLNPGDAPKPWQATTNGLRSSGPRRSSMSARARCSAASRARSRSRPSPAGATRR
jgi:YidC/Oxa1 family membrane protein insertase